MSASFARPTNYHAPSSTLEQKDTFRSIENDLGDCGYIDRQDVGADEATSLQASSRFVFTERLSLDRDNYAQAFDGVQKRADLQACFRAYAVVSSTGLSFGPSARPRTCPG